MEEFFALYGSYENLNMPNKKYSKECFETVLKEILNYCEHAYAFAGIEIEKIKNAAKTRNEKLINKGPLSLISKSAYAYYRIKEEGINIYNGNPKINGCNISKFENPGIGIIAVYKGWVMIKKLSLQAKREEVSAMLSASIEKFIEKYYINNYGELPKQSLSVKNAESAVKILIEQYKNNGQEAFLKTCFMFKNFRPFPFIEGIIKAYPELKIKKPKGKVGK
jgi:hypothetical protein